MHSTCTGTGTWRLSTATCTGTCLLSTWYKTAKYCAVCEISWCICQQLTALSISTALVTKLLVIKKLLPWSLPWVPHDLFSSFVHPRKKFWRRHSHFCIVPFLLQAGASTQGGEWCEMLHGENWGECCDDNDAFGRVYNNLLLHEYIYYFTPVHF